MSWTWRQAIGVSRVSTANPPTGEQSPRAALRVCSGVVLALLAGAQLLAAQAPAARTTGASTSASATHAIALVEQGKCAEAIPLLKRSVPHLSDYHLRYHAEMALARCGMGMQQTETAVEALLALEREYPDDPEVLYIATHYFSELGTQASQRLAAKDPTSFQARKLQAESLESQGKTTEAAALYSSILEQNPNTPGIHYRLGQILLAQAGPDGDTGAAEAEFQKETKVDPLNAAAEFVLGELARRKARWPEAIQHFTRATSIDAGFSEAYLALGMSLAASGDISGAVGPLEHYVKMEPDDPAGHYQLAMAYQRLGNRERAAQEIALQAKAAVKGGQSDTTAGHEAAH